MNNKDKSRDQLLEEVDSLKANIFELEKANSDLHKSKKTYKDLFEKSDDAILIIRNGKFADCNKATIKMLHFTNKEDFLNTHPSELSPEIQADGKTSYLKANEMMNIALKNGSHRFEWNHKKSNGEVFPVEVSLTTISNTEKDQIIHTVWRDITIRKQAENALKESEEKLRNILENSTNLFYSHTPNHVLTYISPQVNDILGYTQEEALIKWTDFVSENPINKVGFENTLKAIETGERQPAYELELVKKNSEKIWVEVREAPLAVNGKTTSIVGSLSDITERKVHDLELQQSEQRFKRLFDGLGDAVFVTKIGGKNRGAILEVNSAAIKQTGYTRDELLRMNILHDLYISGTRKRNEDDLDEKLQAGKSVTTTEKKRRKDGSEFWTEIIVTPFEFKGELASLSINHDITSRKKIADALKKSEEHFRAMLENTSIGFYRTTPDGKILFANPALITMLGYSNFDELAQRDLEKEGFDNNNTRSYFRTQIERDGYVKGLESTWHNKQNEIIQVRENAKAFYAPDGNIIYFEGTIVNISEEKQAELLLKESEEKYRTLIDNIQDGVFLIIDGKISFANEAFAEIFGYAREEIIGVDFIKIVAPEDLEMVVNNYKKRMKGEFAPKEYEFQALHKDKHTRVSVNMTVDRINFENKPASLGTIKNISETKKIQEELAIKEKYYRTLFELSPSGIAVIDDKGNIIDVNRSFCNDNGYTPEELKGNKVQILVPEDRLIETEKAINDLLIGKNLQYEVTNKSKDGSFRKVELYETKVTLPNGETGILSIANDITERKRAEQDLINALEKAKESDRLKSTFLSNMSHELRTPLNAIIGFSEIIDRNLPIDEIIEFNKTINSSGMQLLNIVEDIFDISLIETGDTRINKKEENLHSILYDIYKIIKKEQQENNKTHLELNLITPPEIIEITINTDCSRLKQILINLLKNALKFTITGQVTFGYTIERDLGDTNFTFYVKDTGIGIQESKHDIIFDMFIQVEDSHTRIYGGTGIGLSISKKLIELLGGRIWVDSAPGKGSTFYFTLPYVNETANSLNENTKMRFDF